MHDFNLRMTKVMLVALMVAIVFIMVSGVGMLKDNYYWKTRFFAMQADFVMEELAFVWYEYGGLMSWVQSWGQPTASSVPDTSKKAGSVPILLYHGVMVDRDWKPDEVNMHRDDFRAQMFALKRAGYQTVSLEDYLAFMNGTKELPEKSFILTFDDARKDSYYPVDPILRVLGYTAVMNVITGRSLAPDSDKSSFHLSQQELAKMVKGGHWEMASHTNDSHGYVSVVAAKGDGTAHALTNRQWLDREQRLETDAEYAARVTEDLKQSKRAIERRLGVRPLAFAYPFGDFGQESVDYPESKGVLADVLKKLFPITFYQTRGSEFVDNYPGNPFMSRRIDMKSENGISADASAANLISLLENNREKPVDYTDPLEKDTGWLRGWGTFTVGGGKMVLSDSLTDDSSMAFLGGSYLWKDYVLHVKVSTGKGSAFSLLARYEDENSHIACDFAGEHVAFVERSSGRDIQDREIVWPTTLNTGRSVDVGIAAFGNWVGCYLNGKLMISGAINNSLANGGVGFKMWDTNQKGGSLTVSELTVSGTDPRSAPQYK
jgi:peptidoglycan/xylan/chitin deacetylase (PgdA/CDA1 family)